MDRLVWQTIAFGCLACSNPVTANQAEQAFVDQAKLTSSLYFFHRDRERYDGGQTVGVSVRDRFDLNRLSTSGEYESDLDHTTLQAGFNYQSGYWQQYIGFDFAAYGATDLDYTNEADRNVENEFTFAGKRWGQEKKTEAYSDVSILESAVKLKVLAYDLDIKAGYTQLNVPGVIGVNWSNYPGTYRGIQITHKYQNITTNVAWADEYKAPWYRYTESFYRVNAWEELTEDALIDYIYGVGVTIELDDTGELQFSYGRSENYMHSYHAKYALPLSIADSSKISYLFYGSESDNDGGFILYDGFAWQQGLRFELTNGQWFYRLEAMYTRAEGFGNYLPRLTRGYANSQGSNEFWWDSRSDWNHDREKAVFAGIWYQPSFLEGLKIGVSGAYGWDAVRWFENELDKSAPRGKEHALNFDISYQLSSQYLKGTTISLHYTDYTNEQDELGSWYYPNMFASEHDIKLAVMVPVDFF